MQYDTKRQWLVAKYEEKDYNNWEVPSQLSTAILIFLFNRATHAACLHAERKLQL